MSRFWMVRALLGMGHTDQAVALLERQVATLPAGRPEEAHGILAYAYARAGRATEARTLLETMRARSGGRFPATGATAAALEELGDHKAAVALLEKAIAQHDVWLVQFSRSTRYDKLRRDTRAAAMLDRLGTRWPERRPAWLPDRHLIERRLGQGDLATV